MMDVADDLSWLMANCHHVHQHINWHREDFKTVAQEREDILGCWSEHDRDDIDDWKDAEDRDKAVREDILFRMSVYPCHTGSFYIFEGTDPVEVIHRARLAVEKNERGCLYPDRLRREAEERGGR